MKSARAMLSVGVLLLFVSGCGHALGYTGAHPGFVKCTGKGSITGTGTGYVGAGVGGVGTNSFTLQADCGSGFEFQQGRTDAPPTPAK